MGETRCYLCSAETLAPPMASGARACGSCQRQHLGIAAPTLLAFATAAPPPPGGRWLDRNDFAWDRYELGHRELTGYDAALQKACRRSINDTVLAQVRREFEGRAVAVGTAPRLIAARVKQLLVERLELEPDEVPAVYVSEWDAGRYGVVIDDETRAEMLIPRA